MVSKMEIIWHDFISPNMHFWEGKKGERSEKSSSSSSFYPILLSEFLFQIGCCVPAQATQPTPSKKVASHRTISTIILQLVSFKCQHGTAGTQKCVSPRTWCPDLQHSRLTFMSKNSKSEKRSWTRPKESCLSTVSWLHIYSTWSKN